MIIVILIITYRSCTSVNFCNAQKASYSPGKVNHARTDNNYLWCHVVHGSLFLSHNFLANNKTQVRYIKTNVILLKDTLAIISMRDCSD